MRRQLREKGRGEELRKAKEEAIQVLEELREAILRSMERRRGTSP